MLVAYSDSDSDTQDPPRTKRRKVEAVVSKSRNTHASPPPPPASFHALYATNVRTAAADDPSLHGGRTRQVAHVEGNWPTHIYLEWTPSKEELCKLESVINHCQEKLDNDTTSERRVHPLLRSSLNVQLPLHISLSAPLVLQTAQKDDFLTAVKQQVSESGATSFTVHATRLDWVSNFDQTRSFLVLKLSQPDEDDLNKLLHACNACANKFGLHLLYQRKEVTHKKSKKGEAATAPLDLSAAFHISIAWKLEKAKNLDRQPLEPTTRDELCDMKISFDALKVKIGNVVTDLKLPK